MSSQQSPANKARVLRTVLILAAVLVVGLGLLIAYPIVRIRIARERITSYCEAVPIGQAVDLAAMAKDAERRGFRVIGPMEDRGFGDPVPTAPATAKREKLMVVDGWLLARWFCDVSTEGGVATKKRVSFLD